MLEYVTSMPDESDTHDRAHKYPFVVSDILSQENSSLIGMFFEEEETEEPAEPEEEE
jgi:hypothetical protein